MLADHGLAAFSYGPEPCRTCRSRWSISSIEAKTATRMYGREREGRNGADGRHRAMLMLLWEKWKSPRFHAEMEFIQGALVQRRFCLPTRGERRDESLSHGLDHFFKPRVGWPHCLTDARSGSNSIRQDLRPKRFLYSRDRHLPGRKPDCRKSVQYHARLFPRRGRCGHVDGARDSFYSGSSRSRDRLSLGNVRRKGRVRVECRHAPSREPDTIRRTGCRP